ncbi:MAG TPA: hypothetical protein VHO03_10640 [Ignavibacteriales bacterium]|nr:hypothetical protein [Ignavibacteriales bacterium]
MKSIFNNKILTLELTLLLLCNVVLLNLPLTNILGYEYSAINGILITLLGGIYTLSFLKKNSSEKETWALLKELFQNLLPLAVLPLLMGLAASLFVRNCSLTEGVLYYLVLSVPSLIVGACLAITGFLISSRFSYLLFTVAFLLALFLPLLYIYFNPQIYFFNPVIGYFPGTIYDEAVEIDFKLISYRLLNILYFASSAYFALRIIRQSKFAPKAIFLAALLAAAVIFILLGDTLGYSTSRSRMVSELGGHVSTEHFEIYYDSRIARKDIESIILHNEYYYEVVSTALKVSPSEKLTTFLFFDSKEKKKLLGSANADVAKPWRYELYINYGNYEQTLQHEIVHLLSKEFGVTPFKISAGFNPSLLEGLAVAMEDNFGEHTVHYMASLAYNNGFRFPIERLFQGLNFFGELSSLSYVYAGSFIKFLIENYGVEKLKEVYRGGDFSTAYGKPLGALVGEYYSFIASYKPLGSPDEAIYYYGRKPIFKKVCARFLAENIDRAWNLYNSGKYQDSEVLFRRLLNYSESYQALLGYVTSLRKTDKTHEALKVLRENLDKYTKTSYYYNLELLTADLSALNKNYLAADSIYRRISLQRVSREFDYLSQIRMELVRDTSLIRKYLKGSDFDKYTILKAMNSDSISYSTIPVLIGLSEKLEESYPEFMKSWIGKLKVSSFPSSYAAFRLSDYALRNLAFQDSRVFLTSALSYKSDSDFSEVLRLQLKRINWFLNFGEMTLSGVKWQ